MSDVVDIRDLSKTYHLGREQVHALDDVQLVVPQGQFAAIMGASGSGKTTLLNMIGGLDQPDSGSVHIAGQLLTAMSDYQRTLFRRRQMGIVFQAFNLLPTLTALENVMLPLQVDGQSQKKICQRALDVLEQVGLTQRMHHPPSALSGGEQQRVAIARALINRPALILADEPTGNLDPLTGESVLKLLRSLSHNNDTTIIMVTHEPASAAHADCIHVLKSGRFAGTIEPEEPRDADMVATRYAKLAG